MKWDFTGTIFVDTVVVYTEDFSVAKDSRIAAEEYWNDRVRIWKFLHDEGQEVTSSLIFNK